MSQGAGRLCGRGKAAKLTIGLTFLEEVQMRSWFRILMLAGVLSAPALALADDKPASPPDDKHACVIARTISGWSRLDDRTLVMRAGGRKYLVTFHHPCREANWAYGARTDHFGMCLRPGDALIFSVDSHPLGPRWPHWGSRWPERGFEERCYIKTIEKLPADWTPPPR